MAVWVLLCLLLLWAVLRCSLSFFVVLPSFPSFLQVGLLSPLLLLGGASLPLHSLDGVFGWDYFSLLFCWVVPLGLPLWVVLRYSLSPFAWCCLPSHPFGGAAFSLLFCWVVLLGLLRWAVLRCSLSFCVVSPSFPSFLGWGCVSLPSSVGWCCLASFVGWCCVIPSLFAWCCLPSPPSLGGSLSKRKIKKIEKTKLKTKKKRNKEKQRGKQKEETKKKEKLKSEFLNPIPDEKVHLSGSPPPPCGRWCKPPSLLLVVHLGMHLLFGGAAFLPVLWVVLPAYSSPVELKDITPRERGHAATPRKDREDRHHSQKKEGEGRPPRRDPQQGRRKAAMMDWNDGPAHPKLTERL